MAGMLEIMNNQFKQRPALFFWLLLILFTLPVSFVKIHDIDIWWHMQCGRSILENWSWPDFSAFYFSPVTDNTASLRTTWLGDIFFHMVYLVSGDTGLVVLRVLFVLTACILLRAVAGKDYCSWHLVFLMLVIIGTYQKQLIRNSMFALVLVPAVFWIWHQVSIRRKEKLIWLFPPMLGLWSCLHGSYLLGFGLLFLLLSGEILDIFRGVSNGSRQSIVTYAVVAALSFGIISFWNPTTLKYFNLTRVTHFFQADTPADVKKKSEILPKMDIKSEKGAARPGLTGTYDSVRIDKESFGILESIKVWLNNTIFKTSHQALVSGDFFSPFDKFFRLYVKVAMLSGIIGIVFLSFLIRPVRLSMVLPFAGVILAGLGYLRLVGYIPLLTAAVVFHAAGANEIKPCIHKNISQKAMWVFGGLLTLALWANLVLEFPVKIGSEHHVFGVGRIPLYSKKCPDKVLAEYKNHKVFNSMTPGGYLLYRWFPEKKVFVDGFYAPHSKNVMRHLFSMRGKDINPDFLHAEYEIDLALVDHSSGAILNTFFFSENWYPLYIDTGMVCFVYKPDYESDIRFSMVLFDEWELDVLSPFFKKAVATSLHSIPNALYKKGRIKDGIEFETRYAAQLNHIKHLVDPKFIQVTGQLRRHGETVYGQRNVKAQFYEFRHNAALEKKDTKKAIEYGLLFLKTDPDRLPVILNIAIAYYKNGLWDESVSMLDLLVEKSTGENTDFLEKNKKDISKFYWALSVVAKKNNAPVKAYHLASQAYKADAGLISKKKLYQTGIEIVSVLNDSSREKQALLLLSEMENNFGDSGRYLNDLAWQMVIAGEDTGPELSMAAGYAMKAVRIMEDENSSLLDLAYDTLAEILLRQGKTAMACQYFEKAFLCAPENRRANYEDRPECKTK